MKKMDFRVQITYRVLQESLLTLMKEKSILDISIKDICELAGLSRSTFYIYYKNQYDILRKIEDQTLIESDKIIQRYARTAIKSSDQDAVVIIIEDILQDIASNSNSIQVLLSENGDHNFQKKYFHHSIEIMRRFTEATGIKNNPEDKKAAKYDFVFVIGGMLTLVQEWLKNNMDTPVPQMAKIVARLTRGTLG
jgi:AcrR family transcriptional regulator